MSPGPANVAIVIPTIGRPSLQLLFDALAAEGGPIPRELVVVDDRSSPTSPLALAVPEKFATRTRVIQGRAVGPAAARNDGWRSTDCEWVAFLDDDVLPAAGWSQALADDLSSAGPQTAGIQGRLRVPLPEGRRPTDWERCTAGLQEANWITADMAYRRQALIDVAGFDERFPRAYREDADLALRVRKAGWHLQIGTRTVSHPVRPASRWASLNAQRGNADDALMLRLHGRNWQMLTDAPNGLRPFHVAVTSVGIAALALGTLRRPRLAGVTGLAWLAGTLSFAWRRIAPGPRTLDETSTMLMTSAVIPPLATWHWFRGLVSSRGVRRWPDRPLAVLFDRDGTLIHDLAYNGDPTQVVPVATAHEAVERLRAHRILIGVVTNQSGVARGRITASDVEKVNRRVEELLGPIDVFEVCPHAEEDGCDCRKPQAGLIERAAARLGVDPRQCVVVGDIGSDVMAARKAGAVGILVPTDATDPSDLAEAQLVAENLMEAVTLVLSPRQIDKRIGTM
jgi:histidinol-phosphate phosphatase family protein